MKSVALVVAAFFLVADAAAAPREIPGFKFLGQSEVASVGKDGQGIFASYYISVAAATWTTALSGCSAVGGTLAYPFNPIMNEEVRRELVMADFRAHAWIGARSTGVTWKWESYFNTPMTYSAWANPSCAQTPNSCAYYNPIGGWFCAACSTDLPYICQF